MRQAAMTRVSTLKVSLATTIMISSLLKDSSGGFRSSICTNDYKNHIQETNPTIIVKTIRKEIVGHV